MYRNVLLFIVLLAMPTFSTCTQEVCEENQGFRTLDGTCNNKLNPSLGAAGSALQLHASLNDSSPTGLNRPSAREISNIVMSSSGPTKYGRLTDFFTYFAQFLDHDLIHFRAPGNPQSMPIPVPDNDPIFLTATLPFSRAARHKTAMGMSQTNLLSSFIDASSVYGTSKKQLDLLRNGTSCHLRVGPGNLLPRRRGQSGFFLAGDARVNENPALISFHTLFLREHNRLCGELSRAFPAWDSERTFQAARKIVGAELQAITYKQFLPAILGNTLAPYKGYNETEDPTISSFFSGCAFRIGHSLVNDEFVFRNQSGHAQHVPLEKTFFNVGVFDMHGMEALFRGAFVTHACGVSVEIADAVRNMLITEKDSMEMDLAAINIQRGRDTQVPSYNEARVLFGLPKVRAFGDITRNRRLARRLQEAYGGDVDSIDAWVGGLAEDKVDGSALGALFYRSWTQQFDRIRHGDRFFFMREGLFDEQVVQKTPILQSVISPARVDIMRQILLRNTELTEEEVPYDPFTTQPAAGPVQWS